MIDIVKYPTLLAFLRYVLSWRAWKLNILEQIAFYCAVYFHKDVLISLIIIGSLFRREWPQTIKEHEMTTSDKDARYYILHAQIGVHDVHEHHELHGHHAMHKFHDVQVPLIWLSRYTDLDVTTFRRWVEAVYPHASREQYNTVTIRAADLRKGGTRHVLFVNLEKNTWQLHGETEETTIMFDAFPFFTKQNI